MQACRRARGRTGGGHAAGCQRAPGSAAISARLGTCTAMHVHARKCSVARMCIYMQVLCVREPCQLTQLPWQGCSGPPPLPLPAAIAMHLGHGPNLQAGVCPACWYQREGGRREPQVPARST